MELSKSRKILNNGEDWNPGLDDPFGTGGKLKAKVGNTWLE